MLASNSCDWKHTRSAVTVWLWCDFSGAGAVWNERDWEAGAMARGRHIVGGRHGSRRFLLWTDSDQQSQHREMVLFPGATLACSGLIHQVIILLVYLLLSSLFCSVLQPSSIQGLVTPWTYFLHLSLSSVILIDFFTESPVHVLMLFIQAVRGLPCLRAPGIVPCIIFFSRQLPCFLKVWP